MLYLFCSAYVKKEVQKHENYSPGTCSARAVAADHPDFVDSEHVAVSRCAQKGKIPLVLGNMGTDFFPAACLVIYVIRSQSFH